LTTPTLTLGAVFLNRRRLRAIRCCFYSDSTTPTEYHCWLRKVTKPLLCEGGEGNYNGI
jgi:hypothetical protein